MSRVEERDPEKKKINSLYMTIWGQFLSFRLTRPIKYPKCQRLIIMYRGRGNKIVPLQSAVPPAVQHEGASCVCLATNPWFAFYSSQLGVSINIGYHRFYCSYRSFLYPPCSTISLWPSTVAPWCLEIRCQAQYHNPVHPIWPNAAAAGETPECVHRRWWSICGPI